MEKKSIREQVKNSTKKMNRKEDYEGKTEQMISTGSTLLDLAISGGRVYGGGIPGGILVEVFGPAGCGKTVLLCEIAGSVQRQGGQVMFRDPEARLNKEYAKLFGLKPDEILYDCPDTISEMFRPVRDWHPEPAGKVHGVFVDSLTALTTEMEMEDQDKYGMRRAKEFSEELRKVCRVLKNRNFLMVGSNQIRQNVDAVAWGEKYKSPGGEALGFYASLRLKCSKPEKIKKKASNMEAVIGVRTKVEVYKSSVWKPYRSAYVTILFDYGIDDIMENLKYLKMVKRDTVYKVGGKKLSYSLTEAIRIVEEDGLEEQLRKEVIDTWMEIEKAFSTDRKPKRRVK